MSETVALEADVDEIELTGRRYDTGELVRLQVAGGRLRAIERLGEAGPLPPAECEGDEPWLLPGLVDLQVNGYLGQEFNDLELTPDKVAAVSLSMDRDGVTCYCPTATTHSFEMLSHALGTLAEARRTIPDVAQRVPGFHLEGPYISAEDGPRGAHPKEHVRPPDWDEFQRLQDAAEGGIRILTLSPEYPGSADFIRRVVASGCLVAIGHTAATSEQIAAAVEAGAVMSTHLGNGAHGQIRRHPNYIWDQLADDRLTASLILDGHHLPASVAKCFLRAKTARRCVLVSDLTGMGGMPPGVYANSSLGGVEVLEDGRLVVAGQRQFLAGAALPLPVGLANALNYAAGEVDLAEAVEMCSGRPARLLGLEPVRLEVGAVADLVQARLDRQLPPASGGDFASAPAWRMTVEKTVKAGRIVYSA